MIWKILTILALLTPLAMVVLGLVCWRFPPKGPTWALGFRSRRARAGDESWRFAQNWAGKCWFLLGLGWLVAVLLVSIEQKDVLVEDCLTIYMNMVGLQIGCVFLVILGLNLALLIRFDRFGRARVRKEKRMKKTRPALPENDDGTGQTQPGDQEYVRDQEYADDMEYDGESGSGEPYGDELGMPGELCGDDYGEYDPLEELDPDFLQDADPEDGF